MNRHAQYNPQTLHSAMIAAGLEPPQPIPADGRLHRFYVEGDRRGTRNGWCANHGSHAIYGTWREPGTRHVWQANRPIDPAEYARQREAAELRRTRLRTEREQTHARAAEVARRIWENSEPAAAGHPYLVRKGIEPHLARQSRDSLVIPLHDTAGEVQNVQFIRPDGQKRFLKGGRKKGCFCWIGGTPAERWFVAEGFATAATVHEVTGEPVAMAFDAGNLVPVVGALVERLPGRCVIAADNDETGLRYAYRAAARYGVGVTYPTAVAS